MCRHICVSLVTASFISKIEFDSNHLTRVLIPNVLHSKIYKDLWKKIKLVMSHVLGMNRKNKPIMKGYVEQMLLAFKKIGSSMTLKMHLLNNHFEKFIDQSPAESDEHGERFHQVVMPMERRYKGKRLDAMLAEVCWWSRTLCSAGEYKEEDRYESDDGSGDESDEGSQKEASQDEVSQDEESQDEGSQVEESNDEYFGPEASSSHSETDDEPLFKRKRVNPSTSRMDIDT